MKKIYHYIIPVIMNLALITVIVAYELPTQH